MSVEVVTKAELELVQKQLIGCFEELKTGQKEILVRLDKLKTTGQGVVPEYIPALDFMKAVGIKRWKFDQLIAGNKIKTIKKKRKIYVPIGEVKRYFVDPDIE